MNFLCLIPARSGSKGIKDKNIQKIKKLTLIEHAYLFAKKFDEFDQIIVSTDSKKYLKFLEKYNYKYTNFLRPKSISRKDSTDLEVLNYELKRYEKYFKKKFDYVAFFQPTSPIRKKSDIIKCIEIIKKKKPGALWTISKIDTKFNPLKQLIINKNQLQYYSRDGHKFKSRQLLNSTYIRNGIAYFYSRKSILKFKKILPKNSTYYLIKNKYVNIDTLDELNLARRIF
jgi:CMP-N-acetylneuraminic acid synthetase